MLATVPFCNNPPAMKKSGLTENIMKIVSEQEEYKAEGKAPIGELVLLIVRFGNIP